MVSGVFNIRGKGFMVWDFASQFGRVFWVQDSSSGSSQLREGDKAGLRQLEIAGAVFPPGNGNSMDISSNGSNGRIILSHLLCKPAKMGISWDYISIEYNRIIPITHRESSINCMSMGESSISSLDYPRLHAQLAWVAACSSYCTIAMGPQRYNTSRQAMLCGWIRPLWP